MRISRANHLIVWVSVFLLLVKLPVFAQDNSNNVVTAEAYISTVNFSSSDLTVHVTGELGDACTELGDITQVVDGTTITITVMTTRPADAMCAQILATFDTTIELDASQLTAGANTLIVNGTTFDITIPESAVAAATPEVITCPTPADGESLYENTSTNYCFVYSSDFTAEEIDDTTTVISSAEAGAISSVELVIMTESAGERNLAAIQAQRQADETETTLNFEAVLLGGEVAIVTEDVTARVPNRLLITIHNGIVYTLTVWPIDVSFGAENDLANALWRQVIDSFVFPTDNADATDAESTASCADLTAEDGQTKYEHSLFCFLFPDIYTPIGNDSLVLLSSSEMFDGTPITFVIEVFPANNTTSLDDLANDLTATYPELTLDFQGVMLGDVEALLTESIVERGVGTRHLYTLYQDKIISIQIQPVDAAYESAAESVDELWSMVTESWIFVE